MFWKLDLFQSLGARGRHLLCCENFKILLMSFISRSEDSFYFSTGIFFENAAF
jgi:hypothetical protein